MEDVQDGIKKSIQDGVEEDPTIVIPSVIGKSWAGKNYLMQEIENPKIETILEAKTVTTKICTITTVLETSVA